MIVKPKIRGFFCLTAHPDGCEAHVHEQIRYVQAKGAVANGPKKVLVIGASSGFGLASQITAAFGCQAEIVGVFLGREPGEGRLGDAGWYNMVAFEKAVRAAGGYAKSIHKDAFSDEAKREAIEALKKKPGKVDLVVYSLAAPQRLHPRTGHVAKLALKPIEKAYTGKTLDTDKEVIKSIQLEVATEKEITDTIAVMGGEDWEMWIDALEKAELLARGCQTVAYSYLGPELTWPMYKNGTVGKAKADLERTAKELRRRMAGYDGAAYVGMMKGLVTQASSAIPVVSLYISLLYKIMKEKGCHEGCIEQIYRMFSERLYGEGAPLTDETGRLRLDDLELRDDVQQEILKYWDQITTETVHTMTDFKGYQADFLKLFGFGLPGVDYGADIDPLRRFEE